MIGEFFYMHSTLIKENENQIVIQITIPKSRDFLQCEDNIQDALPQAGCLATQKCLEEFDLDGSPIAKSHRIPEWERALTKR